MTKKKKCRRLEASHISEQLSPHGHHHVTSLDGIDFMYGKEEEVRQPRPPSDSNSSSVASLNKFRSHSVSFNNSPSQSLSVSQGLSLFSSSHLSGTADILAYKRKQSGAVPGHDAAINKIMIQEEKVLHHKEVHDHDLHVRELHALKLEAEELRLFKKAQEAKHREADAKHRKEEKIEMISKKAHRSEHTTEEDKIRREHAEIGILKSKYKWIKLIYTIKFVTLHSKVAKRKLAAIHREQEKEDSSKVLQRAIQQYRFKNERHDAAAILKKFWGFRNVAVKKRFHASIIQSFLNEGEFVHKWWLLASQIRQQAIFLQGKFRSFLACQKARLYVLHCAWYVAERRAQGHKDGRLGDKLTKPNRKRFEEERKEELEQIKGEGLAESLEKVKMELNEHTLLATRGAAGHFQKGQGTRRKTETIRKKKNDRLSASGGFGKGKAKRKGKEKEKERGGGATAGAEKRTKSGKIIKTHDTKVSTNGILSWIPSDSLAVRAFLEETKWEEGVEGGVPEVPWHLFATDKGDRNDHLVPLIRVSRIDAQREFEDRKKEFLAQSEVASQGIKEFNISDVKAMMFGSMRLSDRKAQVRNSQIGGKKIPGSTVYVFKDASHVKFNTWATAGVKIAGKTRVGGVKKKGPS